MINLYKFLALFAFTLGFGLLEGCQKLNPSPKKLESGSNKDGSEDSKDDDNIDNKKKDDDSQASASNNSRSDSDNDSVSTISRSETCNTAIKETSKDISKSTVEEIVAKDRESTPADLRPYIKYCSMHEIHNQGKSVKEMNLARYGLSKSLNCTAPNAPKIVNPESVDENGIVYRFDIRQYWGYSHEGQGRLEKSRSKATQTWNIIESAQLKRSNPPVGRARVEALDENVSDCRQLVYNLAHPGIYNNVMETPGLASQLESRMGVVNEGLDSFDWVTVNDAIVFSPRLSRRGKLNSTVEENIVASGGKPGGYYWRTTDMFLARQSRFPYYDNPIPNLGGGNNFFNGGGAGKVRVPTTPLAASEIIYSMPNGCQGYYIAGNGNQERQRAEPSFVVDPRSNFTDAGQHTLVNGLSCHSCHINGLNAAKSDMATLLESNDYNFDEETAERARELYPTNDELDEIYAKDIQRFQETMEEITTAVVSCTDGKESAFDISKEPIFFMTDQLETNGRGSNYNINND